MLNIYGSLGAVAPSAAEASAWAAYIAALNGDVQDAWTSAKTSYLALKSIRTKLGLPFITSATGEGDMSGGWSEDLDVQAKDLQAMAKVLGDAAADVASGKRKMYFDTKTQTIGIEGFPKTDVVRIELDSSGVPMVVSVATNQPIHVGGTIGAVPLLVLGAAAAGGLVQSIGAYLLVKQALRTLENVSQDKTQRTLMQEATKQQKAGASPEQAKANIDAITQGTVAINKSRAEKTKAESGETDKLADTAVKIGYIALIGGIIYVAAGVISRMPAAAFTPKHARLQQNPRKMPQRGYGYVTAASNWHTTSAEHWDIEVVDSLIVQEYLGTRGLDGVTVDVWRALRRLPGDRRSQVFIAQTALGKA